MKNKPKHVIVLSVDSLSSPDMELINLLPNFRDYMSKASMCDNVTSVYPSLTYPAHTTIITGKYPVHHGIYGNTVFNPKGTSGKWYTQSNYIVGETLISKAEEAGMEVATLLWPVTGKGKHRYNLPEVHPSGWIKSAGLTALIHGGAFYVLELARKFGKIRKGIRQPYLDDFVQESLLYTLEKYKPKLTLVHFLDLDMNRHEYGYAAPEAFRAMERIDHRLGELIDFLKKHKMYDDTALIVLGDHSQIDVHTPIYLNERFEEDGYLQRKNGNIKKWRVYAQSCDGSCYIFVNKKEGEKFSEEVFEYLCSMQGERKSGIGKIYTGEEAKKLGASSECSYMIEARIGYYFAEDLDSKKLKAAHGYLPTIASYQTVFMASGKGIRPNVQVSNISLVDEAPTIARILGIDLGQTDGQCIEDILDI